MKKLLFAILIVGNILHGFSFFNDTLKSKSEFNDFYFEQELSAQNGKLRADPRYRHYAKCVANIVTNYFTLAELNKFYNNQNIKELEKQEDRAFKICDEDIKRYK